MEWKRSRATLRHFLTPFNGSSIKNAEDRSRSRAMEPVALECQSEAGPPRTLPQAGQRREPVTDQSVSVVALAAVGLILGAGAAVAATDTGNLSVRVRIVDECKVQNAPVLDFGNAQGVLDAAVDASTSIDIQCTNTTPYNVWLDAGAGAGATVADRLLTSGAGATISYSLYQDAARAQVWGVTEGTDTVADTGDGDVQTFTVYGRIPAQTTPAPGLYTDLVMITVDY
jgi:spore coat protein U-like protein